MAKPFRPARFSREPVPASDAASLQFTSFVGPQAARQPGPQAIILNGTGGDDTLTGTADADTLNGLGGNDILDGLGSTDDILDGGTGDDALHATGVLGDSDTIIEGVGGGFDTVYLANTSHFVLTAGAEVEVVRMTDAASSAAATITGNGFDQLIVGNAGDNRLDGGGGADVLQGLTGSDTYVIQADDIIIEVVGENGGSDRVVVDFSYVLPHNVEHLDGFGDITITGNSAVNWIKLDGGDQIINGMLGGDDITGGAGADIFIFSTAPGSSNVDSIRDFGNGADRIILGGAPGEAFAGLPPGAVFADAFTYGDHATAPAHRLIYDRSNNGLYYDPDGVGGTAAVRFASVSRQEFNPSSLTVVGSVGNPEDETLSGSNGVDDLLEGLDGRDVLDGLGGNDTTDGGAGNDLHYVGSAGDLVIERENEGSDRIVASVDYALTDDMYVEEMVAAEGGDYDLAGNVRDNLLVGNDSANALSGGGGSDLLYGLEGGDVLDGGAGADFMEGAAGDDVLDGGSGADYMAGGLGNDIYHHDNQGDVVDELYNEGNDEVRATTSFVAGIYSAIETLRLVAGSGADNLTGNFISQTLIGNEFANVLDGGSFDPHVGNNDSLRGGAGDDSYYVAGYSIDQDFVTELPNEGNDRVYARSSYMLLHGVHVEILSTADADGTTAINLTGNELDNVIYGNAGDNRLSGGIGNDRLYGYQGYNVLVGGTGDDWYFVGYGNSDRIFEGANGGGDRVFTGSDYTLDEDVHVEIFSTDWHEGTAAIALGGNERSNVIFGNDGVNIIYGKGGFDYLYGNGGDDIYQVSDAGDLVVEYDNDGNDRIFASVDYTLYDGGYVETVSTDYIAGTAAITLGGNNLANTIIGNAGVNTLYGKGGNDTLAGHGGADTFLFTTFGAGDVDLITDFAVGTDRIAFYSSVYTGLTPGSLPASAFVNGTSAADGDDRILYNSATGALFYDADGTGATAAVQFATVTAGTSLSASDFVVL